MREILNPIAPLSSHGKNWFIGLRGAAASCPLVPMKPSREFALVWVTAPNLKSARRLAQGALAARLAACVNLVPQIESHYWWQDKIQSSAEVLLLIKTTTAKLSALEKYVLANHPYDTPEFVAQALSRGTDRYLAWLRASVKRRKAAP